MVAASVADAGLYPGHPVPGDATPPLSSRRELILSALVTAGAAAVLGGCRRASDIAEQPIDPFGPDRRQGDPLYSQAASSWVAVVPGAVLPVVRERWSAVTLAGNLVALVEDCPVGDLPLRYCSGLQIFQCPGCGSLYNRIGERIHGPAKAGMSRRPVSVDGDGQLIIDRTRTIDGPASGEPLILAQEIDPTSDAVSRCRIESVLPPNPARRSST